MTGADGGPRTADGASARARLRAARGFVLSFPPATEILVVGATREAADDFARDLAQARGAVFGLHRFSLMQLASHLAAAEMAQRGLTPSTSLGSEALAARAAAALAARAALGYFAPVQRFPGFARSLAATLTELRLGRVDSASLAGASSPGPELARLLDEYERQLTAAAVADRADLFRLAAIAAAGLHRFRGLPLLLLDLAAEAGRESELVEALLAGAGETLVTVPAGQGDAVPVGDAEGSSSLARLQRFLFAEESPPRAQSDETVRFFSAPGEARECVEIARHILDEARVGVPFDRIAVFLRTPREYAPLLETAFRRAAIPVYFARGTRRPDAAGRAFLALLACREEGLSARRFAEYLSLAQVPDAGASSPPASAGLSAAAREEFPAPAQEEASPSDESEVAPAFRAPWKWEELLVEAAVIGGRDRWARRLRGLESELRLRLEEESDEEPGSPRAIGIQRTLENLAHFSAFAMPVIEALDALPGEATWGEWLPPLRQLAARALRWPARVAAVLDELEPMSSVGPLAVSEVARVLAERLSTLEQEPPADRHGRVFVAAAAEARGRSFAVVFVPGLAERIFPQRPREDPLLLDGLRAEVAPHLRRQLRRGLDERLLLRLAVGAAEERVHLSYPRVDVGEARPRVTSFYGLDVVRATRGEIPDFEELQRRAFEAVEARLVWPAPPDAKRAIDAVEHDLAVMRDLLRGLSPATRSARYLLELNPWLAQSLRTRYARWQLREWRKQDGLVHANEAVRKALAAQRLRARPYSATALQRYAVCPYQFLLAAIYRFEPREEPAPLEQLDPLTRGRLFHAVQAATLRALQTRPHTGAAIGPQVLDVPLAEAGRELDAVLARYAGEYREALAPPIARVWEDEIRALRADLHTWLRRLAEGDGAWRPLHFEFAFGLPLDAEHDPASRADPVELSGGWKLRGSVDLIERARDGSALRITDHKTGRDPGKPVFAVGGGEVLQPVLYALAVEAASGVRVSDSRLYYCTTRGGFREYPVPVNEIARRHGLAVLAAIDRAVETGMFPPAPRKDACLWCDFRSVCGPYEERRARQVKQAVPELQQLREMP